MRERRTRRKVSQVLALREKFIGKDKMRGRFDVGGRGGGGEEVV